MVHRELLLALHSPVLEPGLDLCLAQIQGRCQLHPVRNREVFLLCEFRLEPLQLHLREDCAELSLSLGSAAEVGEVVVVVAAVQGGVCGGGRERGGVVKFISRGIMIIVYCEIFKRVCYRS